MKMPKKQQNLIKNDSKMNLKNINEKDEKGMRNWQEKGRN